MCFGESFEQSLESLKANKLRSFLTMMGVVMGVFSVVTILAIGSATQKFIENQFDQLGANIISIEERSPSSAKQNWLTTEDLPILKKAVPELKNLHGFVQKSGDIRLSGEKAKEAVAFGIMPHYKNFQPLELVAGRFIKESDIAARTNVALVDDRFAQKYYQREDIVGERITYCTPNGSIVKLTVVGIIKNEGNLMEDALGDYMPVIFYMPLTTVEQIFGSKQLDTIQVSLEDTDVDLSKLGIRMTKALEFVHRNQDQYSVINSADIQKSFTQMTQVLAAVLLVIAVITLIVGGIGIINILLVSVTERTREIGLRKALGAEKKDIIIQFLMESIVLTGISGIIGIVLGSVTGQIISSAMHIPPIVDFTVIVSVLAGSITLGIAFGVYPAKRAADLDPIEALRYE